MSTDGASRDADSIVANVQAVVNELATLKTSYANLQSRCDAMEETHNKVKERNVALEGENARLQQELNVTRQTLQATAVKIEDAAQSARAAGACSYMEVKEELNDVLHQRAVERLEHDSALDALSTQLEDVKAKPNLVVAKQHSAVCTVASFPADRVLPSHHRGRLRKRVSDETTQAANSSSDSEPISSLVSFARRRTGPAVVPAPRRFPAGPTSFGPVMNCAVLDELMKRQRKLRYEPSSSDTEERCIPTIRQRKRSLADEQTESRKKRKQS